MKKTIKSFGLIAGLAFIFTGFCVAQTSISKTFTGVSMIDISTISGSCEIVKSKDHMVHVTLDYRYRPANTFEPVFNLRHLVTFPR